MINRMILAVAYLWASPNTLFGLGVGLCGWLSGSRLQLRRGCFEFHGGWLSRILKRLPPRGVRAITLGHTIIGTDTDSLDDCRNHEHVHVRQYEKWGPLFVPAYLSCSLYLWILQRDYYFENPFEVEAYTKDKMGDKS